MQMFHQRVLLCAEIVFLFSCGSYFCKLQVNLLYKRHVLSLQVCRPWFLCWRLQGRRTSRGSMCCCVKRSWLFIYHCSSMVWALTTAMNSSAWQRIPLITACGLLSLEEGQKPLLGQRDLSFHQVKFFCCFQKTQCYSHAMKPSFRCFIICFYHIILLLWLSSSYSSVGFLHPEACLITWI